MYTKTLKAQPKNKIVGGEFEVKIEIDDGNFTKILACIENKEIESWIDERQNAIHFNFPQKLSFCEREVNGICLENFNEIADAKIKARSEAKAQRLQELKNGTKLNTNFYDGEYLSGYVVFGFDGEILEEMGAAKSIDGWGTKLETEFENKNFSEIEKICNYKKTEQETKDNEAKAKEQAHIAEAFAEAKATGAKVFLSKKCGMNFGNFDKGRAETTITYAMPNGTITEEKSFDVWD